MWRQPGGGEESGQPIHRDRDLLGGGAGADVAKPANNGGYANAAFEQFGFTAGEGPVVGEAFAAVVARDDDNGVARKFFVVKNLEQAADSPVHHLDHSSIGSVCTAFPIGER